MELTVPKTITVTLAADWLWPKNRVGCALLPRIARVRSTRRVALYPAGSCCSRQDHEEAAML